MRPAGGFVRKSTVRTDSFNLCRKRLRGSHLSIEFICMGTHRNIAPGPTNLAIAPSLLVSPRRRYELHPQQMRRIILNQSKRANVGHIGSCLCVVEILAALYSSVLHAEGPDDPERDRFILSKGHAGLALYAALTLRGWLSESELNTFCGDDTLLGVHPEAALQGVDFSTGSLGQGMSIAAGAALAARMQGSSRRVFCLISDGECNEGSVWEAAMFAAQYRLFNLHVIVDVNGQQALGRTREVIDTSNLTERWRAFGWRTTEVDGHSVPDLIDALATSAANAAPHVVLARTTFGKGVFYMEQGIPVTQTHLPVHPINWHYLPMSDHEYTLAMEQLEHSL
jgi:transketolase